jgi:hypothetical protein
VSDYGGYYENTSPFDEEMERIKDHLRKAVKEETQQELEKLRTENREMAGKLADLDRLERAAQSKQLEYERKLTMAEQTARRTVEKEGLRKLLELLREPRYQVNVVHDPRPKCGKCDEDRKLHYTTPRGRETYESCECATTTTRWVAEETLVHSVARRSGKIIAWYHPVSRYSEEDYIGSPTVLKSADGVALEELIKNPRDYGFTTEAAAAVLADALNGADA